jgi:adhesin transport system membrane fusion protein
MKFLRKYREYDKDDIDFMHPLAAAAQGYEGTSAPILLFTIAVLLTIFLIWAYFAEIDEVTHAEGRIIPSSHVQRVSHLEGGIVEEILVREGDVVNKGQTLLKIDNTVAQARLQEGLDFYYRYLAAVERLKAQVEGKPFIVPQLVREKAPRVAEDEMMRYQARKQKLEKDLSIAREEVAQKKQEFLELKNRRQQLAEQYRLANEEIKINEPLVAKGLTSKVDFLRLQREATELKGQLGSTEVNLARAEAAVAQAQEKLQRVPLDYKMEDLAELREAQNKLASAQGTYTTEGDRLTRTEVRSPVKGIIKQLMISTIGGVVKPGEDLVEIVPLEDRLLVEAQVTPADIAFLRPGLKAMVKLTAYDFAIYGGLEAELIDISADTIEDKDKQNRRFYRVRLRTIGNRLSKTHKDMPIMPGMTAEVNILTGKKTVLHYLLKPILRAKQNALTER